MRFLMGFIGWITARLIGIVALAPVAVYLMLSNQPGIGELESLSVDWGIIRLVAAINALLGLTFVLPHLTRKVWHLRRNPFKRLVITAAFIPVVGYVLFTGGYTIREILPPEYAVQYESMLIPGLIILAALALVLFIVPGWYGQILADKMPAPLPEGMMLDPITNDVILAPVSSEIRQMRQTRTDTSRAKGAPMSGATPAPAMSQQDQVRTPRGPKPPKTFARPTPTIVALLGLIPVAFMLLGIFSFLQPKPLPSFLPTASWVSDAADLRWWFAGGLVLLGVPALLMRRKKIFSGEYVRANSGVRMLVEFVLLAGTMAFFALPNLTVGVPLLHSFADNASEPSTAIVTVTGFEDSMVSMACERFALLQGGEFGAEGGSRVCITDPELAEVLEVGDELTVQGTQTIYGIRTDSVTRQSSL